MIFKVPSTCNKDNIFTQLLVRLEATTLSKRKGKSKVLGGY